MNDTASVVPPAARISAQGHDRVMDAFEQAPGMRMLVDLFYAPGTKPVPIKEPALEAFVARTSAFVAEKAGLPEYEVDSTLMRFLFAEAFDVSPTADNTLTRAIDRYRSTLEPEVASRAAEEIKAADSSAADAGNTREARIAHTMREVGGVHPLYIDLSSPLNETPGEALAFSALYASRDVGPDGELRFTWEESPFLETSFTRALGHVRDDLARKLDEVIIQAGSGRLREFAEIESRSEAGKTPTIRFDLTGVDEGLPSSLRVPGFDRGGSFGLSPDPVENALAEVEHRLKAAVERLDNLDLESIPLSPALREAPEGDFADNPMQALAVVDARVTVEPSEDEQPPIAAAMP